MAEKKQDEKKVRVRLTARPRMGEHHHKHYRAAGLTLDVGGESKETEVSELELAWLKQDVFLAVDVVGKETVPVTAIDTRGPVVEAPKEHPALEKGRR